MRIHDTLEPLARAPRVLRELLEHGEHLGDGGFARVIARSPSRVLKLTSCTATRRLLDACAQAAPDTPWLVGLPRVFRRFGALAQDADGFTFYGYEMERLFAPSQGLAMRAARASEALAREALARGFSHAPISSQGLDARAQRRFDQMRAVFEAHYERFNTALMASSEPEWVHCLQLAARLALEPTGLQATFDWLEQFVEHNRMALDLLTEGNLLVSAWGAPVLADPVMVDMSADLAGAHEQPESATARASTQESSYAVLFQETAGYSGWTVRLRWRTASLHDTEAQAQETAESFARTHPHLTGVRVVRWRSAQFRQLMFAEALEEHPLWTLPRAFQDAHRARLKGTRPEGPLIPGAHSSGRASVRPARAA